MKISALRGSILSGIQHGSVAIQNESRQPVWRLHDGPTKPGRAHECQGQDPVTARRRYFYVIYSNKNKNLAQFLAKKSRIPANPQSAHPTPQCFQSYCPTRQIIHRLVLRLQSARGYQPSGRVAGHQARLREAWMTVRDCWPSHQTCSASCTPTRARLAKSLRAR